MSGDAFIIAARSEDFKGSYKMFLGVSLLFLVGVEVGGGRERVAAIL